jgi:NADPH-dependent 2,4-dienoyl-CoA reductase/sulfur reductase-like enzyme/rhodanese-related sulfurtransferase
MMERKNMKVVIIGGVAAGPKAAARLRRLNPDAEITIIERGKVLSYAGCGMPYFVSGDVPEWKKLNDTPAGVIRDGIFFQNVKGIKVLDRTLAQSIDRKNKTVTTVQVETGEQQTLLYDKLVLATGGSPINLPVEGTNLNNVFRLWQAEDALAMNKILSSGGLKNAVIIGGGLIGVEMTEALAKRGLHVTVVEMLGHILPGLLDSETAAFLTRYLRSQKVDILCGQRVTRLQGDDQGNVKKIITTKGEIPADIALISIGVRPNSKLAQDAGLQVGKSGDIVVNEYLQTDDPDIYAGGDCIFNRHLLTRKPVYAPMGSTANKHGRVIANNIMGRQDKFRGILGTAVVKVFDYNVGKTGLTEAQAREAGFDPVTALMPSSDIPHFYPNSRQVFLKLIADRKTRKIVGVQAVGPGEGVKRIDVLATAMNFGATVDDLPAIDLGYAPPYATAIDVAAHAANVLRNKIEGVARSLTPMEVKAMVDRGEDFIWLDVRSPDEFKQKRIEDPRVKLIPLGMLRNRLGELPKEKRIIPFCKISLRGYEAQTLLAGSGFNDVQFMDGGIEAWPYEVKSEK